jgi:transposase
MANLNIFAGFDISKDFFDISILSTGKIVQGARFSNDQNGFVKLKGVLPANAHCIMEATGPYYLQLACWLHGNGFTVSVVNPLVIRRFAQMQLRRVKTDRADAAIIAEYGCLHEPQAWTPPAKYVVKLQQLDAVKQQLIIQLTALSNQLEAFTATGMMDRDVKTVLNRMIAQQQKMLNHLEQKTEQIIRQYHQQMFSNLITIPGIAKKTATVLISITGGFTRFRNAKQLCAYVGMSPRIYESGTSMKGKARICKLGMSRVRAMLYVCSWSAVRFNKSCADLYERLLSKGKAKKLALVAVAHKLLRQAFAVATGNNPYLIQPS